MLNPFLWLLQGVQWSQSLPESNRPAINTLYAIKPIFLHIVYPAQMIPSSAKL